VQVAPLKVLDLNSLNRELRAISKQIDCASQSVDILKEQLYINMRWKRDNAKYVKMLEYISNRKFIHIVEELQGLVMSRLMEVDKMNLARSGM
jgi:hypothetical protein